MTGSLSNSELATFDIDAMLRGGLAGDNDVARRNLFSIGAVGAAVILDRTQTFPRSLTILPSSYTPAPSAAPSNYPSHCQRPRKPKSLVPGSQRPQASVTRWRPTTSSHAGFER